MSELPKRAAVFVDRDGVLVEERGHIRSIEEVRILRGAAAALHELSAQGFLVVVVTNQAAVAKGYLSEEDLATIHAAIDEELEAEDAGVDGWYYCPHHPTEGEGAYRVACFCRIPAPGLLRAAADDHGIDLASSWLVGDERSDMAAAHRAGCGAILVRTGYGKVEERAGLVGEERPDAVCDDLAEAVRWILALPAA